MSLTALIAIPGALDGPAYDLDARLAHADWHASRARLGPVVALRPAGETAARIASWVPSAAFAGAILILGLFAVRLIRAPAAGEESAG